MKRAAVGIIVILLLFCILLFGIFSGYFGRPDNKPPVPNLTVSTVLVNEHESVIFSANGSIDPDGEIKRYYWNFDDGTNKTGKYVDHQYEEGGNYTVVLIVTDNDGDKAVQTVIIRVNALPKPVIEMTLPAYIHEDVYFYANQSYDPDGFITNYTWDLGDGYVKEGMFTHYRYTEKKHFNVTLTVTDNHGAKAAIRKMFPIFYRKYLVEWIEKDVEVLNISDSLNEGESDYITKEIDILNMTKIRFELTWTDDIPLVVEFPLTEPEPNDEFFINITSPYDESFLGGPSSSEKITVKIPKIGIFNPLPDEFSEEAESADKLRESIAEENTQTEGIGEWQINITLTEAGDARNPIILPSQIDNGNSWQIIAICTYYTPVITKII
jgi:chitodextrinase